jgi:hypothetical protein
MRKAVLLFPVMFLVGCASAPAGGDLVSDWNARGFEDGLRGQPMSAIAQETPFVSSDFDRYLAGVAEGLALYCDPANAVATGAAGESYFGVCLAPADEIFEAAYHIGQKMHGLRQANRGSSQAIADARAELWEVKQRETIIQTALNSSSTHRADRLDYISELKSLAADRERLEAEIAAMSAGVAEARTALAERLQALQGGGGDAVAQPIPVSY